MEGVSNGEVQRKSSDQSMGNLSLPSAEFAKSLCDGLALDASYPIFACKKQHDSRNLQEAYPAPLTQWRLGERFCDARRVRWLS